MAGPVRITVIADTKDAVSGFRKMASTAKTMGTALKGAGSGVSGAMGRMGASLRKVVSTGKDMGAALDKTAAASAQAGSRMRGLAGDAQHAGTNLREVARGARAATTGLNHVGDEMRTVSRRSHDMGKDARSAGTGLVGLGSSVKGMFIAAGAAIAASGIIEAFKNIVGQAANLSAALATNRIIFKEHAKDVIKWSKNAAMALGLSQAEALNATRTFGAYFTGVGKSTKESSKLSEQWVTMAANMAAFMNMPVSDAIESLTGGLRGEYDQLQKYVPIVSAAAIQQKALEMTGKKAAKQLTNQDKALALNAIIMESVANKTGATVRAQKGFNVQTEKLKAKLKDTAAAIGEKLLPKLTDLATWILEKLIPAVEDFWKKHGPQFKQAMEDVGTAIEGIKGAIDTVTGPLAAFLGVFARPPDPLDMAVKDKPLKDAKTKADDLNTSLGNIKTSLKELAESKEAQTFADNTSSGFDSLRGPMARLAQTLKPIGEQIGSTLAQAFGENLPRLKAALDSAASIVSSVFEIIKGVIVGATGYIRMIWDAFGADILGGIRLAFAGVVQTIQGALQIVKGVLDVIVGAITGDWDRAWRGMKDIVGGNLNLVVGMFKTASAGILASLSAMSKVVGGIYLWIAQKTVNTFNTVRNLITSAWRSIGATTSGALNSIRNTITNAWNSAVTATVGAWARLKAAVVNGVDNAVASVRGMIGRVRDAIVGGGSLYDLGVALIQGYINGMGAMLQGVVNKAKSLAQAAINAIADTTKVSSPSKVAEQLGRWLVQGYMKGIQGSTSELLSTVRSLTRQVIAAFPDTKKVTGKGKKKKTTIIDNKTQNQLVKMIDTNYKKLATIAGKRDKLAATIEKNTKRLADLQQARAQVVANIADVFRQSFTLVDEAAQDGDTSMRKILLRSGQAVKAAALFASQIVALRARGVSAAVLQDLAEAGPEAGRATARALMGASKAQLAELNKNYASLNAYGVRAGDTLAGLMYDTGKQGIDALTKGLTADKRTLAALEAEMVRIAETMRKAIKKALKIKSPSKVFANIGALTIKGFAEGFQSLTGKQIVGPVARELRSASSALSTAATGTAFAPGAAFANTEPTPVLVQINTGVIVDKRALVDTVSTAFNEVAATLGRPITLSVAAP